MSNFPDFSGKCVSISIMDDDVSHDLFNPRFENQAGRIFIVGESPDGCTESNWVSGVTSCVAWDRVTDYFVFNNLDEYKKAIKISEDFHSE